MLLIYLFHKLVFGIATRVYFKKIVEAEPQYVSLGYVCFMGAMALGRFVTDKATNRFGKVPVLQVSGLLIFFGLLLSVGFPNLFTASIGFLMVGAGVASIVPVSYGIAGRSKLYSPSVALALVSTISFFGFLVGPPLIGFVAELFDLKVSFALIGINGLGILLLTSFSKNVFHKRIFFIAKNFFFSQFFNNVNRVKNLFFIF